MSDKDVMYVVSQAKRMAYLEYENGGLHNQVERMQKDIDYKALRIKDLIGEIVLLRQRFGLEDDD